MGVAKLLRVVPDYARLAWWGLVAPRAPAAAPDVIVQAVIVSEQGVLLAVRQELRGWELPGGSPLPGEAREAALLREVREETGLEVAIVRVVGEYRRSGFRPHTAFVYACRVVGGALRASPETPQLAWCRADRLPDTIFPWHRGPLEDALAELREPVLRHEHQGLGAIAAGMRIDLRMRWRGEDA
jgi:ADP-ribose pyrophosphatase YjhB (NUDIX family)